MAKKTFEDSIAELEKIVSELESGTLSLEESLKKFEAGVKLSKSCSEKLDETEKKINLLIMDNAGNVSEIPFHDPNGID